jgi:hypothetical protein|tara:strand:+ start:255 stop:671 length:417 start_codon:yes stop_codon:yes gene_type:complete
MEISDAAYLAGLFDADGSVQYKQYMRKKITDKKPYPTWNIRIEINMTDKAVIQWVHETVGLGTFNEKPPGKGQLGKKMQYRWRCGYRDALYVAKLLWPYAKVKLHKIEQIIDHYEPEYNDHNVVSLEHYKMWIKDEKR